MPIPAGPLVDYHGPATWSDYHRVYGLSWSFQINAPIGASGFGIKTATAPLTSYHVGFRVVRR